jgi:hypothetical protein
MNPSDETIFKQWFTNKGLEENVLNIAQDSFIGACAYKNAIIDRLHKDYAKDMSLKNKEIEFLKSECKRIYDPIREFWNSEKNEELLKLTKELETLKLQNSIMREALIEASEYSRCDDVNGQADEIAKECLDKLYEGVANEG